MDAHADPNAEAGIDAAVAQPVSSSKRKLVRRTQPSVDAATVSVSPSTTAAAATSASNNGGNRSPGISSPATSLYPEATGSTGGAPSSTAVQDVSSEAEANALVKRIRQLESEGTMLSNTLTKVCDENSRLSNQVAAMETKLTALAEQPLQETSVLHSLFEPEKTGWFGGSKTAAREQLEKLSETLQSEFMAYKASHASSNEEVQALVEGLHNAHLNAQELSKLVHVQQQTISSGTAAVSIRVVPAEENIGTGAVQELQAQLRRAQEQGAKAEEQLRNLQTELRTLTVENTKLRNDAITRTASTPPVTAAPAVDKATADALAKACADRDALRDELAKVRNSLVEKNKEATMHKQKVEQMQNQLTAKESVHTEEIDNLKQKLAESFNFSISCSRCDELRQELARVRDDLAASQATVQDLRNQILDNTVKQEEKYRALEKKLAESSEQVSAKDQQLQKSTSVDVYEKLKSEQEALRQEIELYKQRIIFLEETHNEKETTAETSLDETHVLEMLNSTKDRISKLEFERDQLIVQLQQAQSYALSRDAEGRALQQRSEEDKQRVTFLLKKCASLTSDVRSLTTQLDTFKEQYEKQSLELKQEKRNTEGMAALQKQFDDLSREKRLLEDRLAATQQVEERLVKAKETIAYMELAQSSSINMSQYAELKAEKEKLANTMEPLQRKLEEAKAEIERLKSVTDAQQAISSTQNNNVRTWQDQVTALSGSEAKLREKVTMLTNENTRLTQVNASLEQQMNDMQDGIREMAVHMEQDRTTNKAAAEASSQKEIQALRDELAQAKATIAEVQARDGQYVAEGLYQSVVAERDKANEEIKRISCELEKRKSEILIYRQTIADLEQENDERVKEIEALQDRYQTDRTSLNDRLTKEQKRTAELTSTIATNTAQITAMEAEAQKNKATIAELQEKAVKQQRAFEDKCRREEALSDEIKRLQGQISTLQAAATTNTGNTDNKTAEVSAAAVPAAPVSAVAAAATLTALAVTEVQPPKAAEPVTASPAPAMQREISTHSAAASSAANTHVSSRATSPAPPPALAPVSSGPDPIVIETFQRRIYDLQTENERIASELKRTQLQRSIDAEEDRRTITLLQTQVKNKMSSADRTAYTAAIAKADSLKKSVESLMAENAQLKQQLSVRAAPANQALSASSLAIAGSQQMDILQLQAQLQEQKSTFDIAMEKAAQDREAYEARIQELEEQLHEAEEAARSAAVAADATIVPRLSSGAAAAESEEENDADGGGAADPSPLGKPAKKKVKKIRKKKTLAEQVGAIDDGQDILAAAPMAAAAAAADRTTADPTADLQVALAQAQRELTQLKAENTQLKATIADLTAQLKQAEDDIQAAHEDLELAQTSMDEERRDLNKQIALLQEQKIARQPSLDERQTSTRSGNSSFANFGGKGSFRNQAIADSQMQLRCCQDELGRVQTENRDLKNRLAKAEANEREISTTSLDGLGTASSRELRKLQKKLKQKDAEIKALADQLMPTKEKLVEYMAMADRLGLQYPFPPELEGATVMRLKALHVSLDPRAASAPALAQSPQRRQSARSNVGAKAEDVSPPPRAPKKRRTLTHDDEEFSLR
jgi:chromosome segregation ATPase